MQLTAPVAPLSHWALSPDVVHLNHGSYGGCPRAVFDAAAAIRVRLEAAPMRFLVLEWQAELDRARRALAQLIHAPEDQLVFVPSATTGVATALASVSLAADDEIIATSHGYRAVKNQLVRLADARGARVVTIPIAVPYDPDAFVADVAAAITPRTRLAVLDHITSPTALCIPLERIIPLFAARGIPVLIDGAHAPGQLELDLRKLGATWYTGNNHKWLCAPKGTGFLVTTTPLRPLVTSHGASPEYGPPNRLHAELDWMGTYDPTPHLAVPTAIATIDQLGGGWSQTIARNHALAIEMRRRLIDALGGSARHVLAPEASLGSMAAVPIALPAGITPFALQTRLLTDGWEVPVIDFASGPLVRISAHLYNHAGQAEELAHKLRSLGVQLRDA
ncbi:MAG: aminotransferase class [Myxococcales bacterium]|nr:aminotransferase class [Myxococcales bacterium]